MGRDGRPLTSAPMNRLIVKPIPHNTLAPQTCPQLVPVGRGAKPSLSAMTMLEKMPTCFPSTSPDPIASVSGPNTASAGRSPRVTPALAKPNSGTIR
jgi:hypothetical protein